MKGGHVTCFWKAFNKDFPKRCHKLTFSDAIGFVRLDDNHKVG